MPGLSYLGFSAWVSINGEALPTYQIEQDGSMCTGWIASVAGRQFSVSWKDESRARIATSGHVFIDGRDVASAIMRPGRTMPVERMGAKTSARRVKPFKFSVLDLTDDDSVADRLDPHLSEIGTIRVEITRVKLGAEVAFKGYDAQEPGVVHERAKKMGAHCTSFDPSKRMPSTRTVAVSTAPYDEDNAGPYVTFIFKYRSADLLRAQGIIPNSTVVKRGHDPNEIMVISDDDEEYPATKRQRLDSDNMTQPPSSLVTSVVDVADVGVNMDLGEGSEISQEVLNFGAPSLLKSSRDGNQMEPGSDDVRFKAGDADPELRERTTLLDGKSRERLL